MYYTNLIFVLDFMIPTEAEEMQMKLPLKILKTATKPWQSWCSHLLLFFNKLMPDARSYPCYKECNSKESIFL
jgi:hypothetical protein